MLRMYCKSCEAAVNVPVGELSFDNEDLDSTKPASYVHATHAVCGSEMVYELTEASGEGKGIGAAEIENIEAILHTPVEDLTELLKFVDEDDL